MKHTTSEHTTTRQTERASQHDASAGPNATSMAPPAYGIDFVDRGLADAGPLSVTPPSLIQTKPMTASPGEGSGTPEVGKKNETGLPDALKAGVETLSGLSMDDVSVHYNSPKPAQLQALAYTQGTDIHVGPGQARHLPHEAWHVVQQKQGRVKPTMQLRGKAINDDARLENEANVMGRRANATTKFKGQKGTDNNSLARETERTGDQIYNNRYLSPRTLNASVGVRDKSIDWESTQLFSMTPNQVIQRGTPGEEEKEEDTRTENEKIVDALMAVEQENMQEDEFIDVLYAMTAEQYKSKKDPLLKRVYTSAKEGAHKGAEELDAQGKKGLKKAVTKYKQGKKRKNKPQKLENVGGLDEVKLLAKIMNHMTKTLDTISHQIDSGGLGRDAVEQVGKVAYQGTLIVDKLLTFGVAGGLIKGGQLGWKAKKVIAQERYGQEEEKEEDLSGSEQPGASGGKTMSGEAGQAGVMTGAGQIPVVGVFVNTASELGNLAKMGFKMRTKKGREEKRRANREDKEAVRGKVEYFARRGDVLITEAEEGVRLLWDESMEAGMKADEIIRPSIKALRAALQKARGVVAEWSKKKEVGGKAGLEANVEQRGGYDMSSIVRE